MVPFILPWTGLPCKYLNVHSLNCLSPTLLKSGLPCSNLEECQHCASAVSDKMSLEIKNLKFLLSAERSVQDDQYSGIRWQFWCRDLVEALSWCHAVWNLPPVATMMRRRRRKFTKTMGRTKTTTVTETRQKRSLSWLSNSPTQMIAPVILLHDKYSRTQQENLLNSDVRLSGRWNVPMTRIRFALIVTFLFIVLTLLQYIR